MDIEKGIAWALDVAADSNHGYDQAQRWGPDYDCSSFVITALKKAGLPLVATYTGNMRTDLLKNGFVDVTASCNLHTGAGVLRGDVLLNDVHHTALALGGGQLVQASINEKGTVTGGRTGDQTGREIFVRSYYNYPWNSVLRHKGTVTAPTAGKSAGIVEGLRTLRRGDTGYSVYTAQLLLIHAGFLDSSYSIEGGKVKFTEADNEYGTKTEAAVLKLQQAKKAEGYSIDVDGILGPQSWKLLIAGV